MYQQNKNNFQWFVMEVKQWRLYTLFINCSQEGVWNRQYQYIARYSNLFEDKQNHRKFGISTDCTFFSNLFSIKHIWLQKTNKIINLCFVFSTHHISQIEDLPIVGSEGVDTIRNGHTGSFWWSCGMSMCSI